jgi:hypothetical protein
MRAITVRFEIAAEYRGRQTAATEDHRPVVIQILPLQDFLGGKRRTLGRIKKRVSITVGKTVFTNLFNRVHQTPLDFPPAANI